MSMIVPDPNGQIYNASESDQIFVIWNNGAGKNEGRGKYFGILSYWHFSMGIDA